MTSGPPVRYGILGFGNHGLRRLVPGFALAKASVLHGIWRRDADKAYAKGQQSCSYVQSQLACYFRV
jgi:hypothetical protein